MQTAGTFAPAAFFEIKRPQNVADSCFWRPVRRRHDLSFDQSTHTSAKREFCNLPHRHSSHEKTKDTPSTSLAVFRTEKPAIMPPRVESFASLSRSIDSTESIKGKPFQTILSSRDASSPSNAALPSAELRSMIEDQADRRGYVTAPTPIEHMPRLSKLSENGPELYVKRDDVSLQVTSRVFNFLATFCK